MAEHDTLKNAKKGGFVLKSPLEKVKPEGLHGETFKALFALYFKYEFS